MKVVMTVVEELGGQQNVDEKIWKIYEAAMEKHLERYQNIGQIPRDDPTLLAALDGVFWGIGGRLLVKNCGGRRRLDGPGTAVGEHGGRKSGGHGEQLS